MAGVFVPAQAASLATVSHQRTGGASTLFNAQFQLGGAIGVAIVTTVLTAARPETAVGGHHVVNLAAYHVSFIVAAAIAAVGVLAAATVRDRDAASTVVPRTRKELVVDAIVTEAFGALPDAVAN
jgi:hypothetical protein